MSNCQASHIHPVFVIDGFAPEEKLDTWVERWEKKAKENEKIFRDLHETGTLPTARAVSAIRSYSIGLKADMILFLSRFQYYSGSKRC